MPAIEGIDHPMVMNYLDVIGDKKAGWSKGCYYWVPGGIGFDTAEYITHSGEATSQNIPAFMKEWGYRYGPLVLGQESKASAHSQSPLLGKSTYCSVKQLEWVKAWVKLPVGFTVPA